MTLQVWLSSKINPEALQAALVEFVGDYPVVVGRNWETVLPPADSAPPPWFGALLYDNPSEFPLLVDVFAPTTDVYQDQQRLAKFLSSRFGCRALCDGSRHGDSESPYWCVIWDGGRSYLADDCNTLVADGEGGPVRVVRPLAIEMLAEPDASADGGRDAGSS